MPMVRRTAAVSVTTSSPATRAVPEVGSRTVDRIRHSVVLPAPFGPRRPCTSPSGIARERPSRAARGFPPLRGKVRRRSSTSTMALLVVTFWFPFRLSWGSDPRCEQAGDLPQRLRPQEFVVSGLDLVHLDLSGYVQT